MNTQALTERIDPRTDGRPLSLREIRALIVQTYHGRVNYPQNPEWAAKKISWDQCQLWLGRELGLNQAILTDALFGSGYLRCEKVQRLAGLLNCAPERLAVLAHHDAQQWIGYFAKETAR